MLTLSEEACLHHLTISSGQVAMSSCMLFCWSSIQSLHGMLWSSRWSFMHFMMRPSPGMTSLQYLLIVSLQGPPICASDVTGAAASMASSTIGSSNLLMIRMSGIGPLRTADGKDHFAWIATNTRTSPSGQISNTSASSLLPVEFRSAFVSETSRTCVLPSLSSHSTETVRGNGGGSVGRMYTCAKPTGTGERDPNLDPCCPDTDSRSVTVAMSAPLLFRTITVRGSLPSPMGREAQDASNRMPRITAD